MAIFWLFYFLGENLNVCMTYQNCFFFCQISEVFPTGSEVDSKEKAALQTLKKVQTISDFSKTNLTEQDCKKCQNANSSNDSSKCVYYVSDDEINEVTTCKRAIMRPRRSRKYRHDSFKENEQEQESEDNEPKSPILPWKKSDVAAPPSPLSMVRKKVPRNYFRRFIFT